MKIERIEGTFCRGGENPLWDEQRQCLYFIDNTGMKLHRYSPDSGMVETWDMPSVITTFALCQDGRGIATFRSGIQFIDLIDGALEMIFPLPGSPEFVFNDGTVDRQGRFLIGASTSNFAQPAPDGGLYRLDPDLNLHKVDEDIHFSNGPCLSPDGATLYFSDSWRKTVYAYDYEPVAGLPSGRRPFVDTTQLGGLPDGATVDATGTYWVAIYGGGKVAAYSPNGELERVIEMPVKLVSSVTFGGPDLDRLFVTTIAHGALGEPVEPGAGFVYVIDGLNALGRPGQRFRSSATALQG